MESYVKLVRESLKPKKKETQKNNVTFLEINKQKNQHKPSSKIAHRKATPFKSTERSKNDVESSPILDLSSSSQHDMVLSTEGSSFHVEESPKTKSKLKRKFLKFEASKDCNLVMKKSTVKKRKVKKQTEEKYEKDWMEEVGDYDFNLLFSSYDLAFQNQEKITIAGRMSYMDSADNLGNDFNKINLEQSEEITKGFENFEESPQENVLSGYEEEQKEKKHFTKGSARYFSVGNDKIVILKANSSIYFHGLMTVKVLHGMLEIMGYNLLPQSKEFKVYSPRGSALLFLKNPCILDSPNERDLSDFLPNLEGDIKVTESCCVFLCKKLEEPKITFLEKHISQRVFPEDASVFPRVLFEPNSDYNFLRTNEKWERIVESIVNNSKTIIVGGKGVGKSTFLRYAINKLLTKFPKIRVLDLDPGQSEFTPSGLISIINLVEPIFGPNYTHLKQPERSWITDISPGDNPKDYLERVAELAKYFEKLEVLPTLVNYMGYVTGLGPHILASCMNLIKPDRLIQINGASKSKNLKGAFTPRMVAENNKLIEKRTQELNYEISMVESMVSSGSSWSMEPRQSREMCIIAYFGEIMKKNCVSIIAPEISVFESKVQQIKITNLNYHKLSPMVANANIVALCSNDRICHGYGIVRGIDSMRNSLYLITPVSEESLKKVDCLIVGVVTMPPSLLMTTEGAAGLVPFVSRGELSSFNQFTKRSYLPPGKK